MDVMFDIFFDTTERCRHVQTVKNCEGLATGQTHKALSGEDFSNWKLRTASESQSANVDLVKKTF